MRYRIRRWIVAALAALLAVASASLAAPQAADSSEIERLIADLATIDSQSTGLHASAWSREFMAIDEAPRFTGGILGSPRPVAHPTMKRLVQLGVQALPALLAHLDDPRESALVIKHDHGFGGMWHAQEYDPREKEKPHAFPVDLAPDEKPRRTITTYTVRVGDICYVLVGQIVGRQLAAVRYQPSACIIINSPVESPALAAACRRDWQGLTPEDHERFLLQASKEDRYFFSSLKRLVFYYPANDKAETLRLLNESDQNWSHQGRTDLIKMLQSNPDPVFDTPIHEIFQRMAALPPPDHPEQVRNHSILWERDTLAEACARRMIGKGRDDEYRRYAEKRLSNPGLPNIAPLLAIKTALEAR